MTMWLAYAKTGKEMECHEELSRLGITAHCARKVEVKRLAKRHRPDVFIDPVLPNYLFVECDDATYKDVTALKHIAPNMVAIPRGDIPQVMRFLAEAQRRMDERLAAINAGERLEQFQPGDLLDIISGSLAGMRVKFRAIVERDPFPVVQAEICILGKTGAAEFSALDVRRAIE